MRRSRGLTLSIVLIAAGTSVGASTLLPLRLDELALPAESVVVGTVADVEPRYNDARTLIVSDVTLAVEETIAGVPASFLTISEYGGRVGDVELVVPGLPHFAKGDRVLLFACRDAVGLLRTCGASQGRFRLVEGSGGGPRAVGAIGTGAVDEPLAELEARVRSLRAGAGR